ncbi:hypothetical protein niasHS_000377 [Heterodera schachtii]|uniref:Effector protein n=1 Tax=Heterodera schachtii TaxID=97005 RepID=A0ABD2K1J5_HETSC
MLRDICGPDICGPDICGPGICGLLEIGHLRPDKCDICGPDICGPDICGLDICGLLEIGHLRPDKCDICGPDICGPDICGPGICGLLEIGHLRPDKCALETAARLKQGPAVRSIDFLQKFEQVFLPIIFLYYYSSYPTEDVQDGLFGCAESEFDCGPDICGPDICGLDICGLLEIGHLRPDKCGPDICGLDICGLLEIGHLRPDKCCGTYAARTFVPISEFRKFLGPRNAIPGLVAIPSAFHYFFAWLQFPNGTEIISIEI